MPNWVSNSITIEGNPTLVKQIKEQVSKPYVMPVESFGDLNYTVNDVEVNSDFSFWNIIKPTNMEEYPKQPWTKEGDDTISNPDSWYNWNIRNWGVKWDTTNPQLEDEVENGENLVLVYSFETAWGVPDNALIELSRQFPSVLITNEYQEETGWGGETEYANGKILSDSTYGWKCWECDHTEDESPYCEDCEYDMCPACGYGEPMDEDREKCPTHSVVLDLNREVEV